MTHTMPPSTTAFFDPTGCYFPDYRPSHPQVALYNAPAVAGVGSVPDVVYVDIALADPLLRMWQAGIATLWSCQGEPSGKAYCVIAEPTRTYEAMQIIGTAFNVHTFHFDSLRETESDGIEVIRWASPVRGRQAVAAHSHPYEDGP